MAHELKSPLAAVEGYLRIVDKRMAGDELSNYDKMIKRSMTRLEGMRKMIFDILDLTRIESGKMKRELKQIDIIEVLKDSIDSVSPDADQRGIHIHLNREEPLFINGDQTELEIISNNFMTNGVKYNKDNGSLNINLKEVDEFIIIDFIDTGIGMTEENKNRLFGEFVRIKSDETKNITGSGLGLSIVKKLVGFYKGSVEVKTALDEGSVFSVKLKKEITMDKKILLVDDDYDVREYMRVILETKNYKTLQAENIRDAEGIIKNENIDLIILDVMMEKDSDGFTFAQKIRSDNKYKSIPIIMVTSVNEKTGFKFDKDSDGAFLPVDAFIEKPVDAEKILAEIDKLIN